MGRYYIILLLVAINLSGCLLGPNYEKVQVNTPEQFRFDSVTVDSAVNLKWWEIFDDPVLDSLIDIALNENKDLLIAAYRIEQARLILGISKAEALPKINVAGEISRGNFLGFKQESAINNIYAGASLNWEIDFWGKFKRMAEASRAELLASEYGRRSLQISLISEVAHSYFTLLDFHWRLQISRKTLQSREKGLGIIQERYNKGIIPEIDLNQAQIQRAIAAASIPIYTRLIGQTENALQILLGRNPNSVNIGEDLLSQTIPPDIPNGLPSDLLLRRPDISEAEQYIIAQNAQIGVAQAHRWPAISLTGLLGVASDDLSTLTSGGLAWSAGATLLGPLFNFGQNKKRVEIERQRLQQAILDYEFTVIQSFREVEDALIGVSTLKEELIAREQHVDAALNAENLSQQRYDKGVTSYLEVLETQRSAFEAELSYSQTLQELLNGFVDLYKALGGGWISEDELSDAAENPE